MKQRKQDNFHNIKKIINQWKINYSLSYLFILDTFQFYTFIFSFSCFFVSYFCTLYHPFIPGTNETNKHFSLVFFFYFPLLSYPSNSGINETTHTHSHCFCISLILSKFRFICLLLQPKLKTNIVLRSSFYSKVTEQDGTRTFISISSTASTS